LRWAIEQHMPAEAVKTGRNVWLARYRLLLEAWWPRAIGAAGQAPEADATAIVMKIGREVRDMLALDAPKQTGGASGDGGEVTVVPVDGGGRVDPGAVAAALTERTRLVSVMAANGEIGVLEPLAEIGAVCRERGVLFHTDAAQMAGKLPLDVGALGVDLLSMCAHKLYGPKGVGLLYVRERSPRLRLEPLLYGGGHERGRRSGTLPVPLVVGFARAVELCLEEMPAEVERITALRERLREGLADGLPDARVNGDPERRLPGNLNVCIPGVEADALIAALKDVALSAGSACASASGEPSHVLRAIGLSDSAARASLRFGLGRSNTPEQVERVVQRVLEEVGALRERSPGAGRRLSGN